jgi:ribosomal protein L11 methyltransferase
VTKIQQRTAPEPAVSVARFTTDEARARQISDLLVEMLDPAAAVCTALERPDKQWQVEVHFRGDLDAGHLRSLFALATGDDDASAVSIESVAPRDWVKESLEGLPPVAAGRFVVHGAHDRASLPVNKIGIEIEAATAFGTGHHGTTRGCLLALDSLLRGRRPRHILDLGTGSGVLAIAAAKALRRPVLATDIDKVAVRAAIANARHNGVGAFVETIHAADLQAPQVAARAPFDLVMANILLSPLRRLAWPIGRVLEPNARVILSGLLLAQAESALAAYRPLGLMLERRIVLEGWITLVLVATSR